MTTEEKTAMYMKLTKKELVSLLITSNDNLDIAIKDFQASYKLDCVVENVKISG